MFEINRNRSLVVISGVSLAVLGLCSIYWLWRVPKTCETSFNLPDASLLTPENVFIDDPLEEKSRFLKALIVGYPQCEPSIARKILELHPDIRFLSKDTKFWNAKYYLGRKWYKDTMPKSLAREVIMEEAPYYINSKIAFFRMRRIFPELKLFIVVQNPFVSAMYNKLNHTNSSNFLTAKKAREIVPFIVSRTHSFMSDISFIHRVFPAEQVFIVDIEQVKKHPESFMSQVVDFLDLQTRFPKNILDEKNRNKQICLDKNHTLFPSLVRKLEMSQKDVCISTDRIEKLPVIEKSFRQEFEMMRTHIKEAFFMSIRKRFDW